MNSPASKPSCAAESARASVARRLVVNRIQRFCLQDGPGLRTTVFTQRCGLRCWWCHNPDTIPSRAPAAHAWDVAELAEHCLRDERFWRHGKGGLTVSGGECLLQAEPLAALLEIVRRRGHPCTIDTAGHAPLAHVQRVAPLADLWLRELKAASPEVLRAWYAKPRAPVVAV